MKLERVNVSLKHLLKKGEEHKTNVYMAQEDWDDIMLFKKEFYDFSGQKITAAYLFRNGAKSLIRSLRVQMAKAKSGKLHAKSRDRLKPKRLSGR